MYSYIFCLCAYKHGEIGIKEEHFVIHEKSLYSVPLSKLKRPSRINDDRFSYLAIMRRQRGRKQERALKENNATAPPACCHLIPSTHKRVFPVLTNS